MENLTENFLKKFLKKLLVLKKIKSSALKTKLKILDSGNIRDNPEYVHCKEELHKLFQEKINGAIIRSRCNWFEYGENRQSFF